MGICRHLVFIVPEDALILEAIANFLLPHVLHEAPTKRAYFSRNLRQPRGPTDLDESFSYEWWSLWPQFQSRIMEFSEYCSYTVVTDVASYYDSIDFTRLRNFLSGFEQLDETSLDFIFYIFEVFVWRPDYLPHPGRGLPQINIDAPRLVAHAFLFDVDRLLEERTSGHFVRWLDDIDFGCNTLSEAKQLLGELDNLLLSRGLHLNPSKTRILQAAEAAKHFCVSENRYLTILQKRIRRERKQNTVSSISKKFLRRHFYKFWKNPRQGQWQKVLKRYFSIASEGQDTFLEPLVPDLLQEFPGILPAILKYYRTLGWSRKREDNLIAFVRSCADDAGVAGVADLLVSWPLNYAVSYLKRMRSLIETLPLETRSDFLFSLRLAVKFLSQNQLEQFLRGSIEIWRSDPWLGRQVAGSWPRLNAAAREMLSGVVRSYGLFSAYEVIENFQQLSFDTKKNRNKVKPFLLAPKNQGIFTLPKLLISLAAIETTSSAIQRQELVHDLLERHSDSIYRYYIIKASLAAQQAATPDETQS